MSPSFGLGGQSAARPNSMGKEQSNVFVNCHTPSNQSIQLSNRAHYTERLLTFGCRRLGHILHGARFLVRVSSTSSRRIDPMKMVKACLPPIRLRFGTKPAFDTFTY